jgi:hypothetical protein
MAPRSVLIVGAGLAGSRCAETLRAEGFDGRIVIVGDEPMPPYERPASRRSSSHGSGKRRASTCGPTPSGPSMRSSSCSAGVYSRSSIAARYAAYGVDLRTDTQAAAFCGGSTGRVRAVVLSDGNELACDVALVAVGMEAAVELLPSPAAPPVFVCGDAAAGAGHWTSRRQYSASPSRSRDRTRRTLVSGRISSTCASSWSVLPRAPHASSFRVVESDSPRGTSMPGDVSSQRSS